MRLDPRRCLQCGLAERSNAIMFYRDYWFGSRVCYEKAITPLLDPRYGFDKKPEEDELLIEQYEQHERDAHINCWERTPIINFIDNVFGTTTTTPKEYLDQHVKRDLDRWFSERANAISTAEQKLKNRIDAELALISEEQSEKERAIREKEEEKQRIAQEKAEARLEEERLAQEAEEEKLRPRKIPEYIRLEHTMVIAPSGAGKTTLLQNTLLDDYHSATRPKEQPAYICIDPKGFMVKRLRYLRIFNDSLPFPVVIDPKMRPALNLFTTQGRDPSQLISDFSYIFSTTKQKLTGKQAACFAFCARLLFNVPNANLETLLDLMDDKRNNPIFQRAIAGLPPIPKRFFENDYYEKNFSSTREELKSRIYGITQNDWLAGMFNARTRKLDIAKCIRERRLLLVNTRMTELSEDHQVIGRYIISLVQDAIQSRKERHPVYLVIDEAQEFMDPEKTPRLLRLMREYGGGVILAFQNLFCAELDEATRAAISTNTSIKYAASPEAADLNYVARDLRCTPDFLKGVEKTDTHARFACYVRGMKLQHPFIVSEPFGWIDTWPKLTEGERNARRYINRTELQDTQALPDDASFVQKQTIPTPPPNTMISTTGREYKSQSSDTLKKPELKKVRLMNSDDLERLRAEQCPTDDDDNKPSPWGQ
ncbi:hypothetical protein ACVWW6_000932 [Bradyrhizobium sp. USDA 3311]